MDFQPYMSSTPNIHEFTEALNNLDSRLASIEQRDPSLFIPQSNQSRAYPKIALPEKFNGNQSKFRDFLLSIRNIFALQPDRFPNDETKCRFTGSLMTSEALSWFRYVCEARSSLLLDFEDFVHDFEDNFKDPNIQRQAQMALKKLKQGKGSVVSYATKFRRLTQDTGYNDQAHIDLFRNGLNDEIKDVLASSLNEPDELEPYIHYCIKIDNRLYERRTERQGNRHAFSRQDTPKRSNNNTGPVPMEVDTTTVNTRKGKLTPEERERRKNNKLCMYCGKPNHFAIACPEKKQKN